MTSLPPVSPPRPLLLDGLLLVALCGLVFFLGLGRTPLWDDDETRFAVVAREMVRSGDWIVPRYAGELSDKPAPHFWLIAAGFAWLGESSTVARLPAAICGTLGVLVAWRLAAILCGQTIARWTGLAMATSLLVVVEGRAVTGDAALLTVITAMALLGVKAWWHGGECSITRWSHGRAAAIGALAGIGILFKGLLALMVPLTAFGLFAAWQNDSFAGIRSASIKGILDRGRLAILTLRLPTVLVAAALVAGPWHLQVSQKTNGAWLTIFYLQHHLHRLVAPMEGHRGIPLFQVFGLLCGLFPWSVFLPLAFWRHARVSFAPSQTPAGIAAARFLFVWLTVWVVAFSLPATQLPHYILPAYPAACAMVTSLLVRAYTKRESLSDAWLFAAAGGLVLGGVVMGLVAWAGAEFLETATLRKLAWVSALPLITAALFALRVKAARRRQAALVFAAGAVVLIVTIFQAAAPRVGALNPIPGLIQKADTEAQGRARLATYRFSAPGVLWQANRPVQVCQSADDLDRFLHSQPAGYALVDAAAYDEFSRSRPAPRILARRHPLVRKADVLLITASEPGWSR